MGGNILKTKIARTEIFNSPLCCIERGGSIYQFFGGKKQCDQIRLFKRFKQFFKWANPGLFFIYFRLFNQTIQFLQQINVKNVKSIR